MVVLVDGEGRQRLPVEPDGSFGVSALAAGLYGLEIHLAGHEPVLRFETLLSGANELGTIELEPIAVELLGRVVTQVNGAEVNLEDVSVRLRRDERLVASTTSDDNGPRQGRRWVRFVVEDEQLISTPAGTWTTRERSCAPKACPCPTRSPWGS